MSEKEPEKDKREFHPEPFVETEHSIQLASGTLEYAGHTGRIPLKNDTGEIEAQMFFVAYLKKNAGENRPLIFAFNGGPGSPSLWLHLGALGPKRIRLKNDGFMPEPPFTLEPNESTWLQFADLVFIDPIGTGFSEAKDPETAEKFWGMKGDIDSVSEFIRLFLSKFKKFGCPLFLAGESYGTTRAAGVSENLVSRGIGFNGIFLISSVLNFQTLRHYVGNDLPAILFLPTFAATSWYHGLINRERYPDLRQFLHEVEAFAAGDYASALMKGDHLAPNDALRIRDRLVAFTGLNAEFIERSHLRINIHRFTKELKRHEGITVGRLDSRITGYDIDLGRAELEHDPSMSAIMPPYTMTMNQYVRSELGYESDLEYTIFRGIKKPWNWDMPKDGPPDTSEALRSAMVRNEHMRVFIASGFYDLATPYFATEYTISHMQLPPAIRKNVTIAEYEAGHMMYTHEPSLSALAKDAGQFVDDALKS